MRWARHGEINTYKMLVGKLERKRSLPIGIDGRMMLKWIFWK
jgi:hypothetical protein